MRKLQGIHNDNIDHQKRELINKLFTSVIIFPIVDAYMMEKKSLEDNNEFVEFDIKILSAINHQ